MGLYEHPRSPFWYYLLENTGLKSPPRGSTGIRRDGMTAEIRKTNKAAAEAIYHAKMNDPAMKKAGVKVASKETFLSFSFWYDTNELATHEPSSIVRERGILKRLRQHFGEMLLVDIKVKHWKEYATWRRTEGGISVNSVDRELNLMKAMLVSAVACEHLDFSPFVHLRGETEEGTKKVTLTRKSERRLLDAFDAPVFDETDRAAVAELKDLYLVAVGTLIRQENVASLLSRDLEGHELVKDTKTGPIDMDLRGPTPLQRRALWVLKRRKPADPDAPFFPYWARLFDATRVPVVRVPKNGRKSRAKVDARKREGDPNPRASANAYLLRLMKRACAVAGIPWGLDKRGLVWHTATRASGATRMLREYEQDLRTIQLVGQWSSMDQMCRYLGVSLETEALLAAQRRERTRARARHVA